MLLLLAASALAACGGTGATQPAKPKTSTRARTAAIAGKPPTPQTPPKPPKHQPQNKPRPAPNPGRLPQTAQRPAASTPGFHAEMRALWAGVQHDSVRRAMPAFFPLGAYLQVKAIGDPRGDWLNRLRADYGLDLAAAHALLGSDPASARLLAVHVVAAYAHWVPPGVCDNRVGYYEVPNSRVIYRQRGALRSFGIASMISWRGVWYVVHLCAMLRSAAAGVVDDPSSGAGVSAPSSTC